MNSIENKIWEGIYFNISFIIKLQVNDQVITKIGSRIGTMNYNPGHQILRASIKNEIRKSYVFKHTS